ncbi:MAG TPA: helix-turn-helix transcriptional regulator [Anaerolineales bacterium]|nr:helix-turn-helix transcriptional regulator [Anaerolineales bacterium]
MRRRQIVMRSFSDREKQVFEILLEGHTNHEMASLLGIRDKTVEEHLISIYRKIGVKTRSQAILWWVLGIKGFPSLTSRN